MERRIWIALGMVCLLSTAGCLGVLGGEDGTKTTTTGASHTDVSDETATATTTTAASNAGTETPSPAYSAVTGHREALQSSDGFVATMVQNQTNGDRTANVTATYRIDLANERYYANVTGRLAGNSVDLRRYTAGDTTHERFEFGSQERVRNASAPYESDVKPVNVSRAMGGRDFAGQIGAIDLREDGTERYRGEELRRFTASGPDAWDVSPPQGAKTLSKFRMTLLVDDRGIVRYVEYRLVGTANDGGPFREYYRLEIATVGSLSVDRPDWVAESSASLIAR